MTDSVQVTHGRSISKLQAKNRGSSERSAGTFRSCEICSSWYLISKL